MYYPNLRDPVVAGLVARRSKLSYIDVRMRPDLEITSARPSQIQGLAPILTGPRGPDLRDGPQDFGPVSGAGEERAVPSLFRFLVIIGFLVGIVYAGMFALVTFVDPEPREITVRVPAERLQPSDP